MEESWTGNPAGVVPLTAEPDEDWMRGVALEMNQSETAFFWPEGGDFRLRWFTPTLEVDLCGHATLAAAYVVSSLEPYRRRVVFHTASGALTVDLRGQEPSLDLPAEPLQPCEPPQGLVEALGLAPLETLKNRMDWVAVLEDAQAVRQLRPDLGRIAGLGMRGVAVTSAGGDGYDVVSRFFAPQSGVPEDHATGSLHCALGPLWSERLGRPTLRCLQASPRGGELVVTPQGGRVHMAGRVRPVMRGEFFPSPSGDRGR